jgi:hypothetical protein
LLLSRIYRYPLSKPQRTRGTPHGAAPPTPPGIRVTYHGGSIELSRCRNIQRRRRVVTICAIQAHDRAAKIEADRDFSSDVVREKIQPGPVARSRHHPRKLILKILRQLIIKITGHLRPGIRPKVLADQKAGLAVLAGTQPRHRARLDGQRRPPGDAPGARSRFRVVGDPWELPAQLDSGRQLSLLIEDGADRVGIGLGDDSE